MLFLQETLENNGTVTVTYFTKEHENWLTKNVGPREYYLVHSNLVRIGGKNWMVTNKEANCWLVTINDQKILTMFALIFSK